MKKILLIEDDQDLVELYEEALSPKFEIELAFDGRTGLELAQKQPDLIVLDILLPEPEMNGFELLKKLKQDWKTKDIPVIVLTNLGSKDADSDKKVAISLGAEDYLVKTYNRPDEIVKKISSYLSV